MLPLPRPALSSSPILWLREPRENIREPVSIRQPRLGYCRSTALIRRGMVGSYVAKSGIVQRNTAAHIPEASTQMMPAVMRYFIVILADRVGQARDAQIQTHLSHRRFLSICRSERMSSPRQRRANRPQISSPGLQLGKQDPSLSIPPTPDDLSIVKACHGEANFGGVYRKLLVCTCAGQLMRASSAWIQHKPCQAHYNHRQLKTVNQFLMFMHWTVVVR
jgi:hypothetical protein